MYYVQYVYVSERVRGTISTAVALDRGSGKRATIGDRGALLGVLCLQLSEKLQLVLVLTLTNQELKYVRGGQT